MLSLHTGASIIQHLSDKKYQVYDILIDKQSTWYREGVAKLPTKALVGIDVVVIALHGAFGEDGKLQHILDQIGIPYTGSGSVASAIAMNKVLAKEIFRKAGLKVPLETVVDAEKDLDARAHEIFMNFGMPVVVKPASAGSSVGVSVARDLSQLKLAFAEAAKHGPQILVEQYIRGREATCGVIEHFRNQDLYPLLPIEIIPPAGAAFFDAEVKYNGKTQEICPATFEPKTMKKLEEMAVTAHQALGLRHYSRSDFIVTNSGEIYILETNSLPGLTAESLLPKSLKAVGSNLSEFLDHLITLALKK